MKYLTIAPGVPLCDRKQEAVLAAKLKVLMASDWRPKHPSNAADWERKPLSKSDVAYAAGRACGAPLLSKVDAPDVRGFLVPLKLVK